MDILKIRDQLLNQGKTIYDLPLRVVDYSRISTEFKSQETSLVNQKFYYKKLIEEVPKWTHVGSYIDEGITGTSTKNRRNFLHMVNDGINGKFDLIITKEVSRFARNTLDSIFYIRELLKNGVAVYFENDNINTLYPDSELKLTLMASLAQEESRKTSERIKWAKKRAVEQGKVLMSNMHGYDSINGKIIVNEKEAEFIRKVFKYYCQGIGFRKLGRKLFQEGYKNRNGNPYSYSTLRYIITNPRYKGYYTGNITETIDFISRKKIKNDPEEQVIYYAPDIIPPIVSEEIWDKANSILKKRRKKTLSHETSYQNKYKYSGKIYCKKHNTTFHRTLYKYKTIPDKELYQCKIYRQQGRKACNTPIMYTKEIDAILSVIFKTIFKNKDKFIDKLLCMVEKYLDENDFKNDIQKILNKIDKIKERKDKLLDLVISDLLTKKEFKKRNDEFNASLKLCNKELEKYEELRKTRQDTKKQLKLMRKFLDKDYNLDKTVPEELIDVFVERIYVEAGDIENLVKLEVILKTGQQLPVFYRKDLSLSLITHMNRDKMMFRFPRIKNNRKAKPVTVIVKDVKINIAV